MSNFVGLFLLEGGRQWLTRIYFRASRAGCRGPTSVNEAGGRAYRLRRSTRWRSSRRPAASTARYYAERRDQLDELKRLIDQVDDNVFLAKLAVYAASGPT